MAHRRTVQIVGAIGGTLPITGTAPTIDMFETDGGVNEKWWRIQSNSGTWSVMTLTDVGGAGATALSITRSGTTVSNLTAGAQIILGGANNSTTPGLVAVAGGPGIFSTDANTISIGKSGTTLLNVSTSELGVVTGTISFGGSGGLTRIVGSTANTVEVRNSTAAQTFRVYNTYTDASNNEFLTLNFSGNIAQLYTDKNGSGTYRNLRIGAAGVEWQWDTNGYYTPLTDNSANIGDLTHRVANGFFTIGTFGTNAIIQSSKITTYNAITTAGQGVTSIYADGNTVGATGATASVATYTVGAADGTFEIATNVNVTTATTHNFTVTCTYTDETNTSRTLTIPFSQLSGTILTAITNVTGAGPYEGVKMTIRAKAGTSITIATVGTFTTVTYNVRGNIQQIG